MKRQIVKISVFIGVFLFGTIQLAFSQKEVRKDLRSGNKAYKQENYTGAEIDYRKALEKNARSIEASYNLGNALYRQQKAKEALEQYQATINNETDKEKLAVAWHNAGNVYLAMATAKPEEVNLEFLKQSIDAYKNALRNNPRDDETRYNLALAQKLLDDRQNQNQDQKKDDQQEQKQDQQQQNQPKQQPQEQQQQPLREGEMSQQNADQILDAMMQEEKNTQEKVKAQHRQQSRKKNDKNW
ncbi:MAG: tetratricopeptide repeat protein [Dysgonamonadaceae bacterium]|nr:tetratricopeptide repeat protein [Dysgonamonadaceae bacterium]